VTAGDLCPLFGRSLKMSARDKQEWVWLPNAVLLALACRAEPNGETEAEVEWLSDKTGLSLEEVEAALLKLVEGDYVTVVTVGKSYLLNELPPARWAEIGSKN
jgi:hypothetical protein